MESLTKMVNRKPFADKVQNSILAFVVLFCIGVGLIICGSTEVFSKKTATDDEKSVLKFRLILVGSVLLLISFWCGGLIVWIN